MYVEVQEGAECIDTVIATYTDEDTIAFTGTAGEKRARRDMGKGEREEKKQSQTVLAGRTRNKNTGHDPDLKDSNRPLIIIIIHILIGTRSKVSRRLL